VRIIGDTIQTRSLDTTAIVPGVFFLCAFTVIWSFVGFILSLKSDEWLNKLEQKVKTSRAVAAVADLVQL